METRIEITGKKGAPPLRQQSFGLIVTKLNKKVNAYEFH